MKIDGVYVINMDKEPQNWERTKRLFQSKGYNPIRIPAVDGTQINDKYYDKNCTQRCATFCTKKMVAITASHMKTWTEILNQSNEASIIVEDDVVLTDDFKEKLNRLIPPVDWDILFLGCFGCGTNGPTLPFKPINMYIGKPINAGVKVNDDVHVPYLALGTHCYIVSKKGAARLLQLFKGNIDDHVDAQIQKFFAQGLLKNYSISPLLSSQTSSHNYIGFPRLLNALLEGIFVTETNDMSLSFYLSTPGFEIFEYPINIWSSVFILIAGVSKYNNIDFYTVLQVMLLIFLPDILKKDFKNVIMALLSMYMIFTISEFAFDS